MELNGTLDQFPLSELITIMHTSSVTGVLEVGTAPHAGYLCCRDGRVYHAVCGEATGPAALRQMPEHPHAMFRFIAGAVCEVETLGHDIERQIAYVQEIERLLKQARPYVSGTDGVPVLCESEQPVQVDMTTWQVLAAIDGERTISEIAVLLDLDPLEISAVVGTLVARRLAMITVPPAHRSAPHVHEPPHNPPQPGGPAPEGWLTRRLAPRREEALHTSAALMAGWSLARQC